MADFYNLAMLVLLFFFPSFFLFNVFTFFFHHFYAESLKGKVVLITGASSGIGEQLAYAYGKRGALLVLVARREAALHQVAETARRMGSPDIFVAPADISNPEECRRVAEKAVTRFGKLNHLVTNAGMATFCPFEEAGDITRFTRIMGSKAAMTMFYETLRCELHGKVKITIVHPGVVSSETLDGKGMLKGGKEGMDEEAKDVALGLFPVASGGGCANAIVKSVCRGERTLTWPSWYRLLYLIKFLCPKAIDLFLLHGHRGHKQGV